MTRNEVKSEGQSRKQPPHMPSLLNLSSRSCYCIHHQSNSRYLLHPCRALECNMQHEPPHWRPPFHSSYLSHNPQRSPFETEGQQQIISQDDPHCGPLLPRTSWGGHGDGNKLLGNRGAEMPPCYLIVYVIHARPNTGHLDPQQVPTCLPLIVITNRTISFSNAQATKMG